jgi:hypothetical protein
VAIKVNFKETASTADDEKLDAGPWLTNEEAFLKHGSPSCSR